MSRALAWRHQGGGAKGHVFLWPTLGAAPIGGVGTGQHRPWRLYGRKGGAHGSLFVWNVRGVAPGVTPSISVGPRIFRRASFSPRLFRRKNG